MNSSEKLIEVAVLLFPILAVHGVSLMAQFISELHSESDHEPGFLLFTSCLVARVSEG